MNPFVTIVIPTFNRLALLQQAISSVITQSYSHWELFIVDDGSNDGTLDVIHSMQDSRIILIEMLHSGNIALLRNTGVKAGTGEWLAFLDSDDLWTNQKLEIQLGFLMKQGKRWGYGRSELMNKDMKTIPYKAGVYRPISGWIAKEVLTTEASVNISTLMIERKLFEEVGGFNENADLLFREDYELAIRLALESEAMAIPDLLARIREHDGRATNTFEYGHDRMASVYEYFIRSHPDNDLTKIARRRMALELAESAVIQIKRKEYRDAATRLWKAAINGDQSRHLLSAVRRGFSK